MKILLLIAAWQRRDVAVICYTGVARLQGHAALWGFDLEVCIITSNLLDYDLAKRFGFRVVQAPNKPLGAKMNAGVKEALASFDFSHLMQLGSDDLLAKPFFCRRLNGSPGIFEHLESKTPFFGLSELITYNTETGENKYSHIPTGFGAGRFIRRDIIEKTVSVLGYLWTPEKNKGLDFDSESNISKCYSFHEVRLKTVYNQGKALCVDLKSPVNIHSFEDIPGQALTREQEFNMKTMFPELEMVKIKQAV